MSSTLHLVPAYGRDYKSQKEVRAAFEANLDFLIADISSPDDGRYCNKTDLVNNVSQVQIRYSKLRKVVIIKLSFDVNSML